MTRTAFLLLVMTLGPRVGAQTPDPAEMPPEAIHFMERMQAQTTQVSGREQPALVPYTTKMEVFFRTVVDRSWTESRLHLNEAEYAAIEAVKAEDRRLQRLASAESGALHASICREIGGKAAHQIDSIRLMAQVVEQDRRHDDAKRVRYVAFMNGLSAAGRRSIEEYVEAELVPGISTSSIDALALAAEFPEWAAQTFIRRCSDTPAPRSIIASTGRSWSVDGGGALDQVVDTNGTVVEANGGSGPSARVDFNRIVSTDELLELLQGSPVELVSIRYRDVGSGGGHVTFSPGADARAAIDAAEAYVRYQKLAEAYAIQQGGAAVVVEGTEPMAVQTMPPIPGARRPLDRETPPLRVKREQLDAMVLPQCVADQQIEQPFRIDGPEAPLMEAACGFRPHAIVVRGNTPDIEALAAHDVVAGVSFLNGR